MCSVTFPLVTAELRWMASSLISCSCCCFHRSIWMRTSAPAFAPQLSFERLHLLIAPPVDPPLHATRHRDAQIDASRSCEHKKDEEYKTELF